MGDEGGQSRGTGALGDDLLALGHHLHRALQGIFADQQQVADQFRDDRLGQSARRFDGDAFRDGLAAIVRRELAHRIVHRGIESRLDTDHLDARVQGLGGGRHARHDPPAADGHHDRLQLGKVRQQLQADRALAGNDQRIVIGMHEGQPLARRHVAGIDGGSVDALPMDQYPGAEACGSLDLGEGCALGHHDGRGNAKALSMMGHALGVIARRHGDNAGRLCLGIEARQLVVGATVLERARVLQVLKLQDHLFGAGRLRQARRADGRGAHDMARNHRSCASDIVNGDGIGLGAHGVCSGNRRNLQSWRPTIVTYWPSCQGRVKSA